VALIEARRWPRPRRRDGGAAGIPAAAELDRRAGRRAAAPAPGAKPNRPDRSRRGLLKTGGDLGRLGGPARPRLASQQTPHHRPNTTAQMAALNTPPVSSQPPGAGRRSGRRVTVGQQSGLPPQ
jgi:hypothetical protein